MKLLILTQKVNRDDPILGFFHGWIEEFSKHTEKLTVICLEKGNYQFSSNTEVYSLGKEKNTAPWCIKDKLRYIFNFYRYIWNFRADYDSVFIHMNPIYLVLGGIFWKLQGKKTALWYSHKNVDIKLRVGSYFADKVFTAAKEGFNIKRKNVLQIGHGINFSIIENTKQRKRDNCLDIVHVGRITAIKNLDILIRAVSLLRKKAPDMAVGVSFYGDPVTHKDKKYFLELKRLVLELGLEKIAHFAGSVSQTELSRIYVSADLSVNLAPTGGFDKVVIESIAAGTPVLVSNSTFKDYFGEYSSEFMFKESDPEDLSDKILEIAKSSRVKGHIDELKAKAKRMYSTEGLVDKILDELK